MPKKLPQIAIPVPPSRRYLAPVMVAMNEMVEATLDESSDSKRLICRDCGASWPMGRLGDLGEVHKPGCVTWALFLEACGWPAPESVPDLVARIRARAQEILRQKGQPEMHSLWELKAEIEDD